MNIRSGINSADCDLDARPVAGASYLQHFLRLGGSFPRDGRCGGTLSRFDIIPIHSSSPIRILEMFVDWHLSLRGSITPARVVEGATKKAFARAVIIVAISGGGGGGGPGAHHVWLKAPPGQHSLLGQWTLVHSPGPLLASVIITVELKTMSSAWLAMSVARAIVTINRAMMRRLDIVATNPTILAILAM